MVACGVQFNWSGESSTGGRDNPRDILHLEIDNNVWINQTKHLFGRVSIATICQEPASAIGNIVYLATKSTSLKSIIASTYLPSQVSVRDRTGWLEVDIRDGEI